MRDIKYIGVYDVFRNGELYRDCSLAAIKKMNYIINVINKSGKSVQVISIARNKKITQKSIMCKKIEGKEENRLFLSPAVGSNKRILSSLGEVQARVWLFFWLVRNVSKGEKILVYHSQRLITAVSMAAKLKHFEYVLEVEELYYKFGFVTERMAKKEKKFINGARSLIVSTDNIRKELKYCKKTVLLHGNYQNLSRNVSEKKKEKEYKIVFTGGIETVRNTAFNVCDCAEYLDDCFKIYLLGYGDETSICMLKEKIAIINQKIGTERLFYCGTKVGEEFDLFMSGCDIAINFQNLDEYYMRYAFPSKVLNYLNYGLLVVTTPLETIRNSEIDCLVFYPDKMENTPQSFAIKINRIKNNFEYMKVKIADEMEKLDNKFMCDLSEILE